MKQTIRISSNGRSLQVTATPTTAEEIFNYLFSEGFGMHAIYKAFRAAGVNEWLSKMLQPTVGNVAGRKSESEIENEIC